MILIVSILIFLALLMLETAASEKTGKNTLPRRAVGYPEMAGRNRPE